MTMKKTVFLTGASGNMGQEGLRFLLHRSSRFNVVALVLPTDKDRQIMEPFAGKPALKIVWGDLTNYDDVLACVTGADYVLHVGAVVSPLADHFPELATKVNIGSARNIIRAIKAQPDPDRIKLVYIGTVAQTGNRPAPIHWGRTGDPIKLSVYDNYALSKTIAEREVIESGLKYWVSLRQTGIAHAGLLMIQDPIMFHTPMNGQLEWVTVRDAGRLVANVCDADVPDEFWRRIYNIGGGEKCRVSNAEFLQKTFSILGIEDFRRIFEPNWFATRNFHGQWYEDSDVLENYLHFRSEGIDDFIANLKRRVPWYFKLAGLVPGIIKWHIRSMARGKGGTLNWIENDLRNKIAAYFGSKEQWQQISGWEKFPLEKLSQTPQRLDHGYDETKSRGRLDLADMQGAAEFRGGKCLAEHMHRGDLHTQLKWRCAFDHEFEASPTLVLLAGHWCPHCLPMPWHDDEIAKRSPFFAQVWNPDHAPDENRVYPME